MPLHFLSFSRVASLGTRIGCWSSCLGLIALLGLATTAHADVAVMRPLRDSPPPTPAELAAHRAVEGALGEADIKIVSADETTKRLHAVAENPCLEVDCAGSILAALDADILVAVAVGAMGNDRTPHDVIVGLVDADGLFVNGAADIENGDVKTAARAALNRALTKWPVRNLIPLEIYGSPAGATVIVDGQPKGTLPIEVRVQPGEHEVNVSMGGYASANERVVATTHPGKTLKLKVELKAEQRAASRVHLIGGPLLMAAGAAAIVGALVPLAMRDCNARAPNGECASEDQAQAAPIALWTTLGTLGIAGGITWITLGQRARKHDSSKLQVGLGTQSVALKGRF